MAGVTLATFRHRYQAYRAKEILAQHGISCTVTADDAGGLREVFCGNPGRVMVDAADMMRASDVLIQNEADLPRTPPRQSSLTNRALRFVTLLGSAGMLTVGLFWFPSMVRDLGLAKTITMFLSLITTAYPLLRAGATGESVVFDDIEETIEKVRAHSEAYHRDALIGQHPNVAPPKK